MAKPRPRFVITGKLSANGIDLRGQEVVCLGPSNWTGLMKKDNAKYRKRELDHMKFRIEDKRFLRENKIAEMGEFCIAAKDVARYLSPKD